MSAIVSSAASACAAHIQASPAAAAVLASGAETRPENVGESMPRCAACSDTGASEAADAADETAVTPSPENDQWYTNWAPATASVSRQSEPVRPASSTQKGSANSVVAATASGVTVPPATACDAAASAVAVSAPNTPRAVRTARLIAGRLLITSSLSLLGARSRRGVAIKSR